MKSLLYLMLVVIITTGCSAKGSGSTIVDDLIEVEEQLKEEQSKEELPEEHELGIAVGEMIDIEIQESTKDFSALELIETDVDVSVLPTSLAFAQVSRMMFDMITYEGNTVKIKGMYYHDQMPELGIDRRTIMLLDELSCCQGYFEIILPDGVDYPENGEQMMLIGNYTVATDGEYSYPVLEVTDYIF